MCARGVRTLGSLRTTPMRDWRSASTFSAMRCVRYSSYANGRVRATALLYSLCRAVRF